MMAGGWRLFVQTERGPEVYPLAVRAYWQHLLGLTEKEFDAESGRVSAWEFRHPHGRQWPIAQALLIAAEMARETMEAE